MFDTLAVAQRLAADGRAFGSLADIVQPKSTIHFPAGRRVRSIPFTHGFSTSAFVRSFGFAGRRSHSRAWSPATSRGSRDRASAFPSCV